VKLDKIARQLRRDITASPKKAAALGLMVLVALYFWAPMVWRWLAPSNGNAKTTASASDVILTDDPVDPAASAKRQRQAFAWEKVRRKMAADPRMTPAMYDIAGTNPFRLDDPSGPNGAAKTGPALAQATAVQTDPKNLGLTLTSIAIGPNRRSATISGKNYQEGEIVSVGDKQGQAARGIEFRLLRVEFREVELERLGRTYKLELLPPTLAPGDTIGPAHPIDRR
jgi:hypothetical protein